MTFLDEILLEDYQDACTDLEGALLEEIEKNKIMKEALERIVIGISTEDMRQEAIVALSKCVALASIQQEN